MSTSHRPDSIRAVVFDAYGTLFDVYAISETAEQLFPGRGAELARVWRDKQVDYTRLRSLGNRYASFWQCTQDALRYACALLKLQASTAAQEELLAQYATLPCFNDAASTLSQLKQMGLPCAILSNANHSMLAEVVQVAGLATSFQHLLSVESVRQFKVTPQAYQLAVDTFQCSPQQIVFVSSNAWDVAGAGWFGFTTFWINRMQLPMEELGQAPHSIGQSLSDVIGFVNKLS